MDLKRIYNPKKVYEGYFESYFIRPFCHHYADFKSGETPKDCLRSILTWIILSFGIAGILMGQVGLLGPEVGFSIIKTIAIIWILASIVPIAAVIARTMHTGNATPHNPKMLGIDILLFICCALFFLFGLLMMLTTVNSGNLNPNAGVTDEVDTTVTEENYVEEEPIFTYQDNTPEEPVADTMTDLTDPDAINPEESFDPTITTDVEAETLDSINF
ncbi:MAG: hypothetical protein NC204_04195 [Candidatus Amulumruptor caecigallinarius]|nr:hypothetical protein [Candidatus Amulumruptor caecigallinarius]